jgi:hypothetical protein
VVGFKPYKLVKGLVETLLRESPSHTVGLEPSENLVCGSSYAVSRPHGGLRTKAEAVILLLYVKE